VQTKPFVKKNPALSGRYDGLWKLLTCDRQTPGIERRTALTQRRAVKIKYKDKLFISNGQLTKI